MSTTVQKSTHPPVWNLTLRLFRISSKLLEQHSGRHIGILQPGLDVLLEAIQLRAALARGLLSSVLGQGLSALSLRLTRERECEILGPVTLFRIKPVVREYRRSSVSERYAVRPFNNSTKRVKIIRGDDRHLQRGWAAPTGHAPLSFSARDIGGVLYGPKLAS